MFANGGSGSGGGGGGRIAMWFTTKTYTGNFAAIGGSGVHEPGGAGMYFVNLKLIFDKAHIFKETKLIDMIVKLDSMPVHRSRKAF